MAPARVMEVALVATLLTLSFGFSAAEQIIRLAGPAANHSRLQLDVQGLHALSQISEHVSVIAAVGRQTSEKARVLNSITGSSQGFSRGDTGLYARITDARTSDGSVIVYLHAESFEGKEVPQVYDAQVLAVASIVSSHLLYCTPSKIDHEELGFLELLSRKAHEWANRRARDAAAAVAEIEVTGQIRPQGSADGLAAGAAAAAAARSGREPQVPRSGARGSLEDPDTAIGTLRLVAGRSANFPPLTFVLEDFTTDLRGLSPTALVRSKLAIERKDDIGEYTMARLFRKIGAATLPEPIRGSSGGGEGAAAAAAALEYDALSVQYRSAVNILRAALQNDAPPRLTPAGTALTGAGVAHLLRALVVAAGDEASGMPAIPDVWAPWEKYLLEVAAKEATASFTLQGDMLVATTPPMPTRDFVKRIAEETERALTLYKTILFDLQSVFSGAGRISELNATLAGLAADFASRNDAAVEALLTHSAAAAAAAVETLFQSLPLPVTQETLVAVIAEANTSHVIKWRSAFALYRGCDEYDAAEAVLSTTFDIGARTLNGLNAGAIAKLIEKAERAALMSYKAALEDAKSPMNERVFKTVTDTEFVNSIKTFRANFPGNLKWVLDEPQAKAQLGALRDQLAVVLAARREANEEAAGEEVHRLIKEAVAEFRKAALDLALPALEAPLVIEAAAIAQSVRRSFDARLAPVIGGTAAAAAAPARLAEVFVGLQGEIRERNRNLWAKRVARVDQAAAKSMGDRSCWADLTSYKVPSAAWCAVVSMREERIVLAGKAAWRAALEAHSAEEWDSQGVPLKGLPADFVEEMAGHFVRDGLTDYRKAGADTLSTLAGAGVALLIGALTLLSVLRRRAAAAAAAVPPPARVARKPVAAEAERLERERAAEDEDEQELQRLRRVGLGRGPHRVRHRVNVAAIERPTSGGLDPMPLMEEEEPMRPQRSPVRQRQRAAGASPMRQRPREGMSPVRRLLAPAPAGMSPTRLPPGVAWSSPVRERPAAQSDDPRARPEERFLSPGRYLDANGYRREVNPFPPAPQQTNSRFADMPPAANGGAGPYASGRPREEPQQQQQEGSEWEPQGRELALAPQNGSPQAAPLDLPLPTPEKAVPQQPDDELKVLSGAAFPAPRMSEVVGVPEDPSVLFVAQQLSRSRDGEETAAAAIRKLSRSPLAQAIAGSVGATLPAGGSDLENFHREAILWRTGADSARARRADASGLDSDALSKIRKWDDSMYFSYVLEPFLARDRPAAPWVHGGYPAGETPPVVRLPPGASPYAYTA